MIQHCTVECVQGEQRCPREEDCEWRVCWSAVRRTCCCRCLMLHSSHTEGQPELGLGTLKATTELEHSLEAFFFLIYLFISLFYFYPPTPTLPPDKLNGKNSQTLSFLTCVMSWVKSQTSVFLLCPRVMNAALVLRGEKGLTVGSTVQGWGQSRICRGSTWFHDKPTTTSENQPQLRPLHENNISYANDDCGRDTCERRVFADFETHEKKRTNKKHRYVHANTVWP